jgi:hypothetical protein
MRSGDCARCSLQTPVTTVAYLTVTLCVLDVRLVGASAAELLVAGCYVPYPSIRAMLDIRHARRRRAH